MSNQIISKALIICSLCLLFLLPACKSKQVLVQQAPVDRKLKEQVERVIKAQPALKTANVSKMSATIEIGGRKFSSQATCKLRSDSAMHISIQPLLGFEMFKIEITKDSILAFDKVNKKLYAVDFDYFKSHYGIAIGFSDVEAIITNRFFTIGSPSPDLANCKQAASEGNFSAVEYITSEMIQKLLINSVDRVEQVQLKSNKSDYKMDIKYAVFTSYDLLLFPQEISITAQTAKRQLKVDFKVSKLNFNQEITFNNTDRARYSKGDLIQLMNK